MTLLIHSKTSTHNFIMDIITYPCYNWNFSKLVKDEPGSYFLDQYCSIWVIYCARSRTFFRHVLGISNVNEFLCHLGQEGLWIYDWRYLVKIVFVRILILTTRLGHWLTQLSWHLHKFAQNMIIIRHLMVRSVLSIYSFFSQNLIFLSQYPCKMYPCGLSNNWSKMA